MEDLIHEECGVFGVFAPNTQDVASLVYFGLFALQHRGQESAGIVVNDDGVFTYRKDLGLVGEVFDSEKLAKLGLGNMAIGHVRYGTTGGGERRNAQPVVVNHLKGNMALAHNGNLVNSYELRTELENQGSIFHSTSDTEVIAYTITKERLHSKNIEDAVASSIPRLDGAYSLVIMSPSKLIAVRDVHGFRPLCYGQREDGTYIVASETCALAAVNAKFIRDIEPGEVVVFTKDGIKSIRDHCGAKKSFCVFEYLYIARPDSVCEGCSVHGARLRVGELLADAYPIDADIVVGVPDSGTDAAIGYSHRSGIPYDIGLIKNKYIGRTFIVPGQGVREEMVSIKLNVVPSVVSGKRVILVDDSIVRGTTSAKIVKRLREGGATEVHVLSSAPPYMNPCYYGVDIDSRESLIAANHTMQEIAEIIGADSVNFLSLEDVKKIAGTDGEGFCYACFDGNYPTALPTNSEKSRFERKISTNPKFAKKDNDN